MPIKSNNPGIWYIKLENIIITYNDVEYAVQNTYSCKKFCYWNTSNPYVFEFSDVRLKEVGGRFLIATNNKGVATEVPQTLIQIDSSESINPNAIADKVWGMQQSITDGERKFLAIEQSIDGINQTVGKIEEVNDEQTEKISQFEQTVDRIETSVSDIETTYNDDKELSELRENINSALISFSSVLGIFSADMEEYMRDNRITPNEKEGITQYKNLLSTERTKVNEYADLAINLVASQGNTDQANLLTEIKRQFNESIDNLYTLMDTAVSDGMIVPSEVSTVISLFGTVSTKSTLLKNTMDDTIWLGLGGTIYEELGKISVTFNQIKLSVSQVEQTFKNTLGIKKAEVQGVITSTITIFNNLREYFNSCVKDMVITQEEHEGINSRITEYNTQLAYVVNKYNEILNDINLPQEDKNALTEVYNAFNTANTDMINAINTVNVVGDVAEVKLLDANEKIDIWQDKLNLLHEKLCQSLDKITSQDYQNKIDNAKEEIQNEINDMKDRVTDVENNLEEGMSSGLVDKIEKEKIKNNLMLLKKEKIDIDNRFIGWYDSPFLVGDNKSSYKAVYDSYIVKYNTLVDLCTQISEKTDYVTEQEKIDIQNSTNEYLTALNEFLKKSEEVITIIYTNELKYQKEIWKNESNDINSTINNINDTMNNSFKDEIITEAELKDINLLLIQLDKEKADIDKIYEEIYNNTNLE